ncbi:MAG TPA: asparagine synthase C-terminal domain-containing protein, partial [Gaiellaceae bacterium]|nr:asparagine synthase C-terminal domain-containing protein [Gaiellaceae bacterium]
LAWLRDEPIAEPSEIPLLLLAEEVTRHVKVVLTGDGGDELFGGYPKYRLERLLRAPIPFAAPALRAAMLAAATRPTHRRLSRASETLRISDELTRWASWFRTFGPAELSAVVAPRLREAASADAVRNRLHEVVAPHAAVDPARRMLLADFATYLPDNMLMRADKVLMGASVEGRMPLLARQVVERVSDAPASQRSGLRTSKALLRRAVEDLVPREILHGTKLGFPVPVAEMLLAADGAGLRRLATSERTLSRGLFDTAALRRLMEDRAVPDRELKLFTVVMLELWLRTSVDRVTLGPPASLVDVLEQDELDAPLAA